MRTAGLLPTVVALALLAALGPAPSRAAADPLDALGIQRLVPPAAAPELRLPDLDGRLVDLRDFRGRVMLLGFFTTT